MGLINKFTNEEEINELQRRSEREYELYLERVAELNEQYNVLKAKYDPLIGVINGACHELRNEIKSLYFFLSKFGNVNEEITSFDFKVETHMNLNNHINIIDGFEGISTTKVGAGDVAATGVTGVGAAVGVAGAGGAVGGMAGLAGMGVVFAPALPAVAAIPLAGPLLMGAGGIWGGINLIGKKIKNKKLIEEVTPKLNQCILELKNNISERERLILFCENAIKIADIYRVCVTLTKDTINEKIIPELNAVMCFFYADSIKEDVLYDKEITNVKLLPLESYNNTQYQKHYLFVKNTFDFYRLICTFFSQTALTDLLCYTEVSDEEYDKLTEKVLNIEQQKEEIQKQIGEVANNIIFMEGE